MAGIAVLLVVLLCFGIRYYREIRFKNKALVKNINELLHYKEELYQTKKTNFALQEKVRALNDALESSQGLQEEPESETDAELDDETDTESDAEACDERYGKELYEQMEHLIISGQLYLDPAFSVDKARKLVGIPRNRFPSFMIRYTGERFPKYLNKFRLYHAARLLQENPGYSVEFVARESGIPALRSFHRLFLEEFGVTPTEYRKREKDTDNKPLT